MGSSGGADCVCVGVIILVDFYGLLFLGNSCSRHYGGYIPVLQQPLTRTKEDLQHFYH